MATIKTAISIDEELFAAAETAAEELQIPRSQLFGLALEEFLQRRQNQKLLSALDDTYADQPSSAVSEAYRRSMSARHRALAEGEW